MTTLQTRFRAWCDRPLRPQRRWTIFGFMALVFTMNISILVFHEQFLDLMGVQRP